MFLQMIWELVHESFQDSQWYNLGGVAFDSFLLDVARHLLWFNILCWGHMHMWLGPRLSISNPVFAMLEFIPRLQDQNALEDLICNFHLLQLC